MFWESEKLLNERIDEAIQRMQEKHSPKQSTCCGNLFNEFTFEDLTNAMPPPRKGVYAVRIKNRSSEAPESIAGKVEQLVSNLKWKLVEDYIISRISRLKEIRSCPIIYTGSAGTQHASKNTLKHRHAELSSRHTAMYPIWALLYFDWKLEYGWKVCENPSAEEKTIKERYRNLHQGKNPALVKQ